MKVSSDRDRLKAAILCGLGLPKTEGASRLGVNRVTLYYWLGEQKTEEIKTKMTRANEIITEFIAGASDDRNRNSG